MYEIHKHQYESEIQLKKIQKIREEIKKLNKEKSELLEEINSARNSDLINEASIKEQEIIKIESLLAQLKAEEKTILNELNSTLKKYDSSNEVFLINPSLDRLLYGFDIFLNKLFKIEECLITNKDYSSKNYDELLAELENLRIKFCCKKSVHILIGFVACLILLLFFLAFNKTVLLEYNILLLSLFSVFLLSTFSAIARQYEDFNTEVFSALITSNKTNILNEIAGKYGKIKWNHVNFDNDNHKLKKLYNLQTGLNYTDLSPERQLEYDNIEELNTFQLLFGRHAKPAIAKENFGGIYNDIKFIVSLEKNNEEVFCGPIIKILCNLDCFDKVVIKKKEIWNKKLSCGLTKISNIQIFKENSFEIYTNNPHFINEVFSRDFIELVNTLGSSFAFVFARGDLYILKYDGWMEKKIQIGSLNYSMYNPKQFTNFKKYIREILDIIFKARKIKYLDKTTQSD